MVCAPFPLPRAHGLLVDTRCRLKRSKYVNASWGGSRRLATVSRSEIFARPARGAARANSLQGSGTYRVNDLLKPQRDGDRA